MKAWTEFLNQQEKELGKVTTNKWLRSLKVVKFDACNLYLEASDSFQLLWFQEHIEHLLKTNFLNHSGKPIKVHVNLKSPSLPVSQKKKDFKELFSPNHLEVEATFSHYIVKDSTNIPYQILTELVGYEGAPRLKMGTYNPIYIYGPKGSGKSHLLMATADEYKKQNISSLYIKSETFTEHVIRAFRTSSIQEFRKTYRNIDALLIDDVHLFSRKIATQEELFHTFNYLHTLGLQIILSANCPPSALTDIEERLVSRFEWGITLQLPSLSTQVKEAILLSKALTLALHLSSPLTKYLLETFKNPTSLTRALEALALRSPPSQNELSLESVPLLADLVSEENQQYLTPEKIVKLIAEIFTIKTTDLIGKSQEKEFAFARQLAMYLCRKELTLSYLKIGAIFSRDHSTVMSSIKLITKKIEDKEVKTLFILSDFYRKTATL